MEQKDYFRDLMKRMVKNQGISSTRPRFEKIENVVIISVKNHLKEGVDLECFKILEIIQRTVLSLGVKFSQQSYWYSIGNRLDRVVISFDKHDYERLNKKLETGIF
ncbi:hypothetical protein ACFP7A_04075 [Sporolactobacillus kofuensis]|uniref:Uncharacterized protein n=1 Tax=Sporolactobacillus kofuensis TaxID=269672 RepID=A0ABW1WCC9_9BACL|nr:hypothetical protein [Sporolactobacillus kofuensis]MCO7174980.1 hypothetical protein [Sporolactobacillus kofuensis]